LTSLKDKVGIEDIQMQLNLYREYLCIDSSLQVDEESRDDNYHMSSSFLLFTCFDLNATELELLEDSGVVWFKLGEKFDQWYEERIINSGIAQPLLTL
jgi:hypothetical protein